MLGPVGTHPVNVAMKTHTLSAPSTIPAVAANRGGATSLGGVLDMETKDVYRSLVTDPMKWLVGARIVPNDIFMMLPMRALGYGYALGVGVRFRFCQSVQDSLKAIAVGFVVLHTLHNMHNDAYSLHQTAVVAADTALYDSLAFLLFPTLTTYAVSGMVRSHIKKRKNYSKSLLHWGPIVACLLVIPVVACPLDAFVGRIMNASVRTLYDLPSVH